MPSPASSRRLLQPDIRAPLCLQGDLGGPLGSTVTQQNCDPTFTSTSQLWQPVSVSGEIFKFENIGTGRCLEARSGPSTAAPSTCGTAAQAKATNAGTGHPPPLAEVSFTPGLNRRGVFKSVPDLIAAIEAYLQASNNDPKPFVWTATAEEILEKVSRGRVALASIPANNETPH
jgi:hypothetical protein